VEVIATALAVRTADLAALAISARRALALDALAALAVVRAVAILVAVAEATFWQAGPVDARLTLGAIHIRDADRLGALAIDASLTGIAIRVGGANLRRLLVQACAIETDLTLSAFTIAGADKRRRAIIGDACRARTAIRVGLAPIVERCSATTAEE
jgi:sarcosine oxidase gamma subunit